MHLLGGRMETLVNDEGGDDDGGGDSDANNHGGEI